MPTVSSISPSAGNSNLPKIFAVLFLLVGAVAFAWTQYRKVQPPPPPAPSGAVAMAPGGGPGSGGAPGGGPGGFGGGPPSPEERERLRTEMFAALNLTPEQRRQIDAIEAARPADFSNREAMRAHFDKINAVLTPEQQKQAREQMESRFQARMNERLKVLPESEQAKFRAKLEERRASGQFRFGGPGGRGPGGGGPGGGGPNGPSGPSGPNGPSGQGGGGGSR